MMYPFLTLDDQTEIVHSQLLDDGSVKVYVESRTKRIAFTMRRAFCQNTAGKMFPASLKRRFRSIRKSSRLRRI